MTKSYFREKIGVKLNNSHIYFSEPKKVFLFQLILIADKDLLYMNVLLFMSKFKQNLQHSRLFFLLILLLYFLLL
jgi:hypothetical protein